MQRNDQPTFFITSSSLCDWPFLVNIFCGFSGLVLTRLFVDVGVVLLPPLLPLKEHKTTSQCSDQLFLPHN
jgi:hypothetical protein